ncbi:hypothetical protein DEIPH_ctg084orf0014 [Deinococcus phoenicis]|uniref:Uncharacterized protein n=1 Tax=Deinococcus phoenicis TaxID=1476583 RepID=A0A016QKE4_9DEIO|nr:hypothetical protein [Deinococcus phoenicis]EYB66600.1 hypothetical protein DEIPH_ctg084orf0014 [Deinococcus phoenicis]
MKQRKDTPRPKGPKPVNPPGFLATQDLKERGWTASLIARFLGGHDHERENGLKMGRRRLPPVKLYREERVQEAERDEAFLVAQARAADARERAERARATREARRAALLHAAAADYTSTIHPEPLRKGAVRKAREPYLPALEATLARLAREIGKLTPREEAELRALLLSRLHAALAAAYPWYPAPEDRPREKKNASQEAKPSDWREWEWD